MKEIQIIGDEIYYGGVLVAKLVETTRYSDQQEFIERIED
jgi:hypothetical protein